LKSIEGKDVKDFSSKSLSSLDNRRFGRFIPPGGTSAQLQQSLYIFNAPVSGCAGVKAKFDRAKFPIGLKVACILIGDPSEF